MLTIPRFIQKSSDFADITVDGITFVQFQSRSSEIRHEVCVSQHSLVFVLEGTKYIHSADGDMVVRKGEAFFCRKGCHLMSEMIPENGGTFDTVLFFFDDPMFANFVNLLSVKKINSTRLERSAFNIKVADPVGIYLASMLSLFDSPLGRNNDFLRLKVEELLHYICITPGNDEFLSFLISCRDVGREDLSVVMERYFNKNISLETIAELSGRSLSSFKREFKKTFDTTPARWIRQRRMSWAEQLIRNSNKNITEISYESGYESLSHFSTLFRKNYGVTPREYRAELNSAKSGL
ncbi:helix-turn-helix transcriptional regulator [Desulfovibrio sp. JC022]|uniref:helix-turn-helix transcriptional regulator n=1 Tax=Desulfovibrio sp. JC022 TaxID=2593642 RepID=UPI0013D3B7C2|nr:AraC family transcriptional regulator [Desulfovibrio sp. JC022]NDV22481.1 helix-turn-helix transcriptional regulator [Desulfovibrio sp. JC022]